VGLLRVVAAVDFHKKMEIMKMEEVSSSELLLLTLSRDEEGEALTGSGLSCHWGM